MSLPKISVISIIYQVVPYVEKCIQSLCAQTYENLEIVLVVGTDADGKDDGCLAIAESYAEKDERIKVVQILAAGTGDARNLGLAAAEGEYIAWVDGDDWAEPDMIEKLYDAINYSGADIAVCGKITEYPDRSVPDEQHSMRNLTGKDACKMILEGSGFFFHCWDKLFKASLFEGVPFPTEGQLEDRYVIGSILTNVDSVVYTTTPLYHFRKRNDSISHTAVSAEENTRADETFCEIVSEKYPELKPYCEVFLIYDHITCIQVQLLNDTYSRKNAEKHIKYVRKHARSVLEGDIANRNTKIKIRIVQAYPAALKLITRKQ
ncbi:Glycosyl transferase family 2 [Lachnospiraceae bacterium KH1T2]|nr:Glycosyl transferase family 2 [Lachnospiraceae bacterium KH1T2]